MLVLVKNVPLCRDHGLSDVINIQVKASSCQEEHQHLVSKTCGLGVRMGAITCWILNKVCLLWPCKNDLQIACREKNDQPQFLLFCQPLPGQPKKEKWENWTSHSRSCELSGCDLVCNGLLCAYPLSPFACMSNCHHRYSKFLPNELLPSFECIRQILS